MIEKYINELDEISLKIANGEKLLRVINDYLPFFEKEGIGILGVASYLKEYLRRK